MSIGRCSLRVTTVPIGQHPGQIAMSMQPDFVVLGHYLAPSQLKAKPSSREVLSKLLGLIQVAKAEVANVRNVRLERRSRH